MSNLIDRQAAIDAIKEFKRGAKEWKDEQEERSDIWHRADSAIASALEIGLRVKKIPSAQRWIPCSERMPDDLEEVNVTWVNHEPEPYYDFMKDKPMTATAVYCRGRWYWFSCVCTDMLSKCGKNPLDQMDDAIEVIAWMPLPEPYKGNKNETD